MLRKIVVSLWMLPLLLGCAVYDDVLLASLTGEFAPAARQPEPPPQGLAEREFEGGTASPGMTRLSAQSAPISPVAILAGKSGPDAPLVIVRFADPNVEFESILRAEILRALTGKPDAGIGLLAVSPTGTATAMNEVAVQRNIERVLAALSKAGVADDRILFGAVSDNAATVDEVRVYLLDLSE